MSTSGTIGSLLIELGMDLARLRKDAEEAKRTVQSTVRDMEATAKKGLAAIGVSLSGAAFVGMIRGAIDSAEALGKLKEKSGIAVESLSGLNLLAELGGVGFEAFSHGLRSFNQSLVEAQDGSSKAAKVFKALGVDINAGPEQAFRQFADAVARLEDGELKTATATTILKKAGEDWIPVLNKGAAGIDEAQRKAEALGLAIGPQFAKDATDFNDNMKLISKGSSALGISIAKDTLPAMIEMTNNMVKARESGHGMWGALIEGAKLFFATLGTVSPMMERFSQNAFNRLSDLQTLNAQKRSESGGPIVSGKIKFSGSDSFGASAGFTKGMTPADLEALAAALALNEAEVKRFVAAMQGLEKEYFSLSGAGKVQLLQWETEKGSLRDLTQAHKGELIEMARKVDAYQHLNERRAANVAARTAELDAMRIEQKAIADLVTAYAAERDELAFSVGLIGVSAREQEKMNAVRKIELDLRRDIARLSPIEEGDTLGLNNRNETVAKMRAEAEAQKAAVVGSIVERQAAEREWATGAKTFFDQYVDDATNAAKAAQEVFTTAFRGMEDALVSFVRTGKLDFRQFADAVIEDLIRIEVRKAIAGVSGSIAGAAGAIGAALGFGGAMAGGGDVSPGQAYLVGENGPEIFAPSSGGTVIPNGAGGMVFHGGDVHIDARGADPATAARLETLARSLPQMIAAGSVAAVRRAFNARGYLTPVG